MKRILLFIITLFLNFSLFGQAKRYMTLEHFTNTRCSNCASFNPAFFTLLKNYEGSYHHMTIHPSFPYPNCVLYQANTVENSSRATHYTVGSTPSLVINGLSKKSLSSINASTLNAELNKTSPVQVIVTESGTTTKTVTVEIKTVGTKPNGTYKVYVAALEKIINMETPNREKEHHNVFRKFISDKDGDAITLANDGSSVKLSFNYNIAAGWNESNMYALVLVSDGSTKEVLNSGTKFDIIVANDDLTIPSFKIFPNPVKDQMNISFDHPLPKNTNLMITNIFGREIKSNYTKSGSNLMTIPVSNLPKGIYFLKVQSGNKSLTRKWYKD